MSRQPIVVQLKVGKGLTVEVAKDRWRKVYYEMTMDIEAENMNDVEAARLKAEGFIDGWISKHTGVAKPAGPPAPSDIPQLDIAEIDALPWLAKDKKPAGRGWGWIFGDTKGFIERHEEKDRRLVSQLGSAIRHCQNKLQLGDMIYSYSKDSKFINRKPAQRQSAR